MWQPRAGEPERLERAKDGVLGQRETSQKTSIILRREQELLELLQGMKKLATPR